MASSDSDFLVAHGLDSFLEIAHDPETAYDVLPSELIAGAATAEDGDALIARASAAAEEERYRQEVSWDERLPKHLLPRPEEVPAAFEEEAELEMSPAGPEKGAAGRSMQTVTAVDEHGEEQPVEMMVPDPPNTTMGEGPKASTGDVDIAYAAASSALKQAALRGYAFQGGKFAPAGAGASAAQQQAAPPAVARQARR